jgi:hypothetical protein
MRPGLQRHLILNLVIIKIISLLIGISAIGACLKVASDRRLDRKQYQCIEMKITHNYPIAISDTVLRHTEDITNLMKGKEYLIGQNIILDF